MSKITKDRWILWRQFWTGTKPVRIAVYTDKAEAEKHLDAARKSPSGQWNYYDLEFRPAPEQTVATDQKRG